MDVIQLWDPSHTENATQLSAISAFQTQIAFFFEKGQMASAISYAYAHVLQLVEKVPPKILTPISLNDLRHPRDFNIELYT